MVQDLNILTGETGAGKSILLGSVTMALSWAEKLPNTHDSDHAILSCCFRLKTKKKKALNAALDIYPEDGQVLMSRKIMDGRSINKINGETSTVSQDESSSTCLLDIHGQHEHQSLLYGKPAG